MEYQEWQGHSPRRMSKTAVQAEKLVEFVRQALDANKGPYYAMVPFVTGTGMAHNASFLRGLMLRSGLPRGDVLVLAHRYLVTQLRGALEMSMVITPLQFTKDYEGAKSTQWRMIILYDMPPGEKKVLMAEFNRSQKNVVVVDYGVVLKNPAKNEPHRFEADSHEIIRTNLITKELAAKIRNFEPITTESPYDRQPLHDIARELQVTGSARPHCRLCGCPIQPGKIALVVMMHRPGQPRNAGPTRIYLHPFDCQQPNLLLFHDVRKNIAIVTNNEGKITRVTLRQPFLEGDRLVFEFDKPPSIEPLMRDLFINPADALYEALKEGRRINPNDD